MTPKQADKQIRRILHRFDFVRVRLAMQDMRWEWVPSKDIHHPVRGIPTVKSLVACATDLLEEAAQHKNYIHATGGLYAEHTADGVLRLWFALEEADGRKGEP